MDTEGIKRVNDLPLLGMEDSDPLLKDSSSYILRIVPRTLMLSRCLRLIYCSLLVIYCQYEAKFISINIFIFEGSPSTRSKDADNKIVQLRKPPKGHSRLNVFLRKPWFIKYWVDLCMGPG